MTLKVVRSLSEYEIIHFIGSGAFGKVFLSKHHESGRIYAIKIIKKTEISSPDGLSNVLNENRVMRSSRHPFIVTLYSAFTALNSLCLVMEFVNGGELYVHLSKEGHFAESKTRFYVGEIASAIGYLHEHKVIYRDLKLENILLDKEGHVKLVDFGLSKHDANSVTKTFCGTPHYMAPEIIIGKPYFTTVDWWSLGILAYEMTEGRLPFDAPNQTSVFVKIVSQPPPMPLCQKISWEETIL